MLNVVTGCAGFIGSTLTDALLEKGERVVGIDCFRDYYDPSIKRMNLASAMDDQHFQLLEMDLSRQNFPSINELTGGEPFVIYHMAAQAGVRYSWGSHFEIYIRDNVAATQRLLEWCRGAENLENFVFASSSSVYGNARELPMREDSSIPRPYSPYGVTKLAAEHLVGLYNSNYGLPAVSCRFFTVYGPRQRPDMAFHRFMTAGLEGRAITVYGSGGQTRDFTFVGDIVRGLLLARKSTSGQVYNLGGGNRVSLNHALDTLQSVMGRDLQREVTEPERGDVKDTWADTSKAADELGWTPSTSLEEGLRAEYLWIRESRDGKPDDY